MHRPAITNNIGHPAPEDEQRSYEQLTLPTAPSITELTTAVDIGDHRSQIRPHTIQPPQPSGRPHSRKNITRRAGRPSVAGAVRKQSTGGAEPVDRATGQRGGG